MLKFLLLALLSLHAYGQSDAKVQVFAVGDARPEKTNIAFALASREGIAGEQRKMLEEVEGILKNDFAFYKHLLEGVQLDGFRAGDWDTWNGRGHGFVAALSARPRGAGLSVSAEVLDVRAKKSRGTATVDLDGGRLRDQAHRLADAIYKLVTGKPSIFTTKIYFVSDRSSFGKDTKKELYVMDFDGRRVERLTFFNSTVISPAVSPDGRYVVFSLVQEHSQRSGRRMVSTKNIDLRILDLAKKRFGTVSGQPGVNSGAVYSADGKSLYFTLTTSGNADIYEMPATGGKPRRITHSHAEDVDPTVTADGSSMSFLSNRAGRANIYIMNPREGDAKARRVSFVGQFNASPRYSPDGKEIAFVSWVDNAFDLYRIDAQGSNLARLTKNFGSNEEPWWSPDGEFLIFTSQRVLSRREATQDIYIMNREGEILGQLTQGFGRCFTPRWANQ